MRQAVEISLYDKLGGGPAVETVVVEFYRRVLGDKMVNGFFAGVDMDQQTQQQIKFISAALGGPEEYQGRSMGDAHRDLAISGTHFDRVAQHLADSLAWVGVDHGDIEQVIAAVAPLKADIVTV